jgi:hypothetical protein
MSKSKDLQGEGNYDAAKKFDDAEKKFVDSGKVEQAARDAEPKDAKEKEALERAEDEAKRHAKGEASPTPRSRDRRSSRS